VTSATTTAHPTVASRWRSPSRRVILAITVVSVLSLALPSEAAYIRPGITSRLTMGYDGSQTKDPVDGIIGQAVWQIAISADGRFAAYSSTATNLVPGDVNNESDVFVTDTVTKKTSVVSVASDGTHALGGGSYTPSISADGRFVAFNSSATNLVPSDLNLASDVFVHDRKTRKTEIVSVSSAGKRTMLPFTSHGSGSPSISPEGRYVAYSSAASDLVPGDKNDAADVFLYDRSSRKVSMVSLSSQQTQADKGASGPSVSNNGLFVAFASYSDDLVTDDNNGKIDVFVRDVRRRTIERVSVGTGGEQGTAPSGFVASGGRGISGDGRYVTISSQSDLAPSDTNDFDIYVFDRKTRRVDRISVDSNGREAVGNSSPGSISLDGRYVVISSRANNLTPGDTGYNTSGTPGMGGGVVVGPQPEDEDVYLYDRKFGTMEMLSVTDAGKEAKGHCKVADNLLSPDSSESFSPAVSADGQHIAFLSCASNLVPNDTNGLRDVFLRSRGPHLGVETISGSGSSTVTLSGAATFSGAVLASTTDPATDGGSGASDMGAEFIGGELLYRPEQEDLFLRLEMTSIPAGKIGLLGVSGAGDPRVLYGFRFVANGISYEVRADSLGTSLLTPLQPAMGLFQCTEVVCNEIAQLPGGYGTTGERIVVSIPLSALKNNGKALAEGGVLASLRGYTALGGYVSGASQLIDQITLTRAPSLKLPAKSVTVTVGRTSKRATLTDGHFSVDLPGNLFHRGGNAVTVRTCLGSECQTGHFTVQA